MKLFERIHGAWLVLTGKAFAKRYEPDGSHMGSLFNYVSKNGVP